MRFESASIRDALRATGGSGAVTHPPFLLGVSVAGGRVRVHVPLRVAQLIRHTVAVSASAAGTQVMQPCICVVVRLHSLHSALLAYASVAAVAHTPFGGLILRPNRAVQTPLCRSLEGFADEDLSASMLRCPRGLPPLLFAALRRRYNGSQLAAILAVVSGGAYRVPGTDVSRGGVCRPQPSVRDAEVTTLIGPPGVSRP